MNSIKVVKQLKLLQLRQQAEARKNGEDEQEMVVERPVNPVRLIMRRGTQMAIKFLPASIDHKGVMRGVHTTFFHKTIYSLL